MTANVTETEYAAEMKILSLSSDGPQAAIIRAHLIAAFVLAAGLPKGCAAPTTEIGNSDYVAFVRIETSDHATVKRVATLLDRAYERSAAVVFGK